MEIRIPDLPGSLGAGGRYDGLIGMFLGEDIPACGFSLGLERILVVLEERGSFPDAVTHVPADLLISFMDESAKALALSLATLLRRHHLRVELYPEPDKPAKSIGYADKRGVLFLIVLGSNEVVGEVVTVRHMRTKKRFDVRRSELAERLLSARTQEIHDKDVGNDVRDVED